MPFTLKISVEPIDFAEINDREKRFPLYGANSTKNEPRQRAVKEVGLTVNGRKSVVPARAMMDLFDPGLVFTLRVSTSADMILVAFAGGSGERAYRCKFYAVASGFVRREIYQLDKDSREVITTVELSGK